MNDSSMRLLAAANDDTTVVCQAGPGSYAQAVALATPTEPRCTLHVSQPRNARLEASRGRLSRVQPPPPA
ncbi:MAG: hypothetical protein WDW38_004587 [Sanguina aurantia]